LPGDEVEQIYRATLELTSRSRFVTGLDGETTFMPSQHEREPGGIADDLSVVDVRPDELDEEDGQESDYAANVEDDD
jgi:hypothetical protein